MGYIEQGSIYRVVSQSTSDPVTLAPGEGASTDITSSFLNDLYRDVRGVVLTSSLKARVTVQVIDSVTGKVAAAWVAQVYID